jgi:hypothetical protein
MTLSMTNVDELRDALSKPSDEVIESLSSAEGDVILLGVAGKIGPELAVMARRALDAAGSSSRVIGVARNPDASTVGYLEGAVPTCSTTTRLRSCPTQLGSFTSPAASSGPAVMRPRPGR